MAEKIILEVDVSGLSQSIATATSDLNVLKANYKELTKTVSENTDVAIQAKAEIKAQEQAIRQMNTQLVKINEAQKINGKTLQELVDEGYEPANKSIEQNRKVLNALTAEYNKASAEGRTKLAPTLKGISDEFKKQEGAIGDTRRNVGNYREAFVGAFEQISGGVPILGSFQKAQQGVNMALSANPIGGVILLLTSLLDIFKNNAVVADKLTFVFAALNKGFQSIIDTIVDTVTNFDKLTAAIANPFKFFKDLALGTAEAAKAGYEAAEAIDELAEVQATANAEIKKNNVLIEKNQNILKTRNLTIAERKKAAEEIAKLESDNAKQSIIAANAELKAEQERLKGQTLNGEQKAKLIELQGMLDAAVLQSQSVQEGYSRRIAQLLQKEGELQNKVTKDLSSEAKERQKILDEQIKAREEYLRTLSKLEDDFFNNGRGKIISQFDEKLSLIKGNSERETALREEILRQRDEALNIFDAQELERTDEQQDKVNKLFFKNYVDRINERKKLDAQDISNQKQKAQEEAQIQQLKFQIAQEVANGLVALGNLVGAQTAAGIAFQKLAAGIQICIDTARAISSIITAATASAAFDGPLAIFTTGVKIAAGITTVIANMAKARQLLDGIGNVEAPQFAEGGSVFDVGGKSHAEGGTKYVGEDGNTFEVENGEKIFVLKKTASNYIDKLGGVNQLFGGRSWRTNAIRHAADGGRIQDGGFAIRQTSEQANAAVMMTQFARQIISNLPSPVVSVKEIDKVSRGLNRSIKVSEL